MTQDPRARRGDDLRAVARPVEDNTEPETCTLNEPDLAGPAVPVIERDFMAGSRAEVSPSC